MNHLPPLPFKTSSDLPITRAYDVETANAIRDFQQQHSLIPSSIFDQPTAYAVLRMLSDDGYRDSGASASSMGYMYKVHIPGKCLDIFKSLIPFLAGHAQ